MASPGFSLVETSHRNTALCRRPDRWAAYWLRDHDIFCGQHIASPVQNQSAVRSPMRSAKKRSPDARSSAPRRKRYRSGGPIIFRRRDISNIRFCRAARESLVENYLEYLIGRLCCWGNKVNSDGRTAHDAQ